MTDYLAYDAPISEFIAALREHACNTGASSRMINKLDGLLILENYAMELEDVQAKLDGVVGDRDRLKACLSDLVMRVSRQNMSFDLKTALECAINALKCA